jgi:holo-[acyl-carrier protein] synthase
MAGHASLRVGLDLIEIERIRSALERSRFRERCFTETERRYCDSRANPAQSYAARFVGKEAVGKALGCGVHFTWTEIEIAGRPRPTVSLSGKTKAWAEKMRVDEVDLSLTHSKGMAAAVAILSIAEEDPK